MSRAGIPPVAGHPEHLIPPGEHHAIFPQSRPCGWLGDTFPAGQQECAQGDAAHLQQAGHPVRYGGSPAFRRDQCHLRHQQGQERHRGLFRL